MTFDDARTELLDRIDDHPKDGDVSDILSDLGIADLATEAAGGYSRKRSMMLSSLRSTARLHLYEELEPSIEEADMKDREAGMLPTLFPSDDAEYPKHIWWLDRWVRFRHKCVFGQEYFDGQPAIRYSKEEGTWELGIMRQSSHSEEHVHFAHLSEPIDEEGVEKFLRQSRKSHKEHPSTHRNIDVLCEGWERLFSEVHQPA